MSSKHKELCKIEDMLKMFYSGVIFSVGQNSKLFRKGLYKCRHFKKKKKTLVYGVTYLCEQLTENRNIRLFILIIRWKKNISKKSVSANAECLTPWKKIEFRERKNI